jgi:hypothetical protein
MAPASLPLSLQPVSPSSRFSAASSGFLDSPILLTPSVSYLVRRLQMFSCISVRVWLT